MDVHDMVKLRLTHEIHTSERKSFRGCRRRWNWITRERYYPKTTAKPLEFGVAFHKAMETWYDPNTWAWDREIIAAQTVLDFKKVCEEQRSDAIMFINGTDLEADVQLDYDERVALGIGMLKHYTNKVSMENDINKGWKPVKVEIAFDVLIPNPEPEMYTEYPSPDDRYIWCLCKECRDKWDAHVVKLLDDPDASPQKRKVHSERNPFNGLPVVYSGRLDMLAEDESGRYWIYDWKTAARLSTDPEFLDLDDQVGSYVWALRSLGINVLGFVYCEIKKGFPAPPKRNKTKRLGCWFSVSKSQDVDFETYVKTVSEEDTEGYEAGNYDAFLEWLDAEGPKFTQRFQRHKTQAECDSIAYNIGLEALDMLDPNVRLYPNAGRFSCKFCAFRQPCLEKNNQGDYVYALDTMYERREHYYIRQEASTESKGGE